MPYPFAHPAAVLPLVPLLGRFAVVPALVIGSMVPDAWYLVPGLERADSHSLAGLFWFCLPAGLFFYAAWQLLLARPAAPRLAVLASLALGVLTHLAWDAAVHGFAWRGVAVMQHASTLAGSAFVAWWIWRRWWAPAAAVAVLGALALAALASGPDLAAARTMLRTVIAPASWTLGGLVFAAAVLFRLRR